MNDGRYTIGLEWCGHNKPWYVLRFCGEWINSFSVKSVAQMAMVRHNKKRIN